MQKSEQTYQRCEDKESQMEPSALHGEHHSRSTVIRGLTILFGEQLTLERGEESSHDR